VNRAEGSPVLIEIVRGDAARQLRTEPRMKVLLTGEMSSRRGSFSCRVVDISRGGACIDADRAHERGEDVCFRRGGLQTKGKVVWSRGRRFGIRFDDPIRATELLVQMSHSRTATQPAAPPRGLSPSRSLSPSR
jgi:hypothetical protein